MSWKSATGPLKEVLAGPGGSTGKVTFQRALVEDPGWVENHPMSASSWPT